MSPSRSLPLLLLAAALPLAGACVAEDGPLGGPDLRGEMPPLGETRPTSPGAGIVADLGICGDIVGGAQSDYFIGDPILGTQADVDSLAGRAAVTGRLTIAADEPVDLTPLAGLRCVGSDLMISGNALESVEGLHELEYVGGHLMIEEAPVLRDLVGLRDLRFVMGELRVRRASRLVDLAGLKHVGSVGHLILDENERLQAPAGLDSLIEVDGTLLIHANPQLQTLSGLDELQHIGGPIRVVDNPRLPSCEIAAWAEALVPNGNLDNAQLSGNDDEALCK